MLIMDEENNPHILDDIYSPTPINYFWVLDLKDLDFTLEKLDVLEEIVCSTVTVQIGGFRFDVPANWNLLVWSEETHELDCVEVNEMGGKDFTAFVFGPCKKTPLPMICTVVDYKRESTNIIPSIGKHQMICHPISDSEWVSLTPSDAYNKYLKNNIVADITG
jgi:hypothetical protein